MTHYQKIMMAIGLAGVILLGLLVVSIYHPKNQGGSTPVTQQKNDQQMTEKMKLDPVGQWDRVCKNVSGGYQVKYPNSWTVKKGDAVQGMQVVKDCSNLQLTQKQPNKLFFSSLDTKQATSTQAGIAIRVTPNAEKRTFENPYRETQVDGVTMVWTSKNYGEFYHGSTRYEVDAYDDLSDQSIDDFLSTFTFLK